MYSVMVVYRAFVCGLQESTVPIHRSTSYHPSHRPKQADKLFLFSSTPRAREMLYTYNVVYGGSVQTYDVQQRTSVPALSPIMVDGRLASQGSGKQRIPCLRQRNVVFVYTLYVVNTVVQAGSIPGLLPRQRSLNLSPVSGQTVMWLALKSAVSSIRMYIVHTTYEVRCSPRTHRPLSCVVWLMFGVLGPATDGYTLVALVRNRPS